jgi:hypothetical protein
MLEVSQYLASNYTTELYNKNSMKNCHKNRYEDQWNRIGDPDMNPHNYIHLIFDKGAKSIRWKKDSPFNKCCWEKWLSSCRKLKLDPCLSPCTGINSKWIKNINIRPKTLQLVQESTGNILEAIGIGKDVLSRIPAAKRKNGQMGLHEIKKFLHKRNGI